MALAETEITAGAAYTVRIDKDGLSFKRGNDAVALVGGINGQHEDYYYAPGHPEAFRTGYVKNDDPTPASAVYDGAAGQWRVTIPAAGGKALADLRAAARAYGATVEREDAAPAPVTVTAPRQRAARRDDWQTEDGSGYTAEERAAMPRR